MKYPTLGMLTVSIVQAKFISVPVLMFLEVLSNGIYSLLCLLSSANPWEREKCVGLPVLVSKYNMLNKQHVNFAKEHSRN